MAGGIKFLGGNSSHEISLTPREKKAAPPPTSRAPLAADQVVKAGSATIRFQEAAHRTDQQYPVPCNVVEYTDPSTNEFIRLVISTQTNRVVQMAIGPASGADRNQFNFVANCDPRTGHVSDTLTRSTDDPNHVRLVSYDAAQGKIIKDTHKSDQPKDRYHDEIEVADAVERVSNIIAQSTAAENPQMENEAFSTVKTNLNRQLNLGKMPPRRPKRLLSPPRRPYAAAPQVPSVAAVAEPQVIAAIKPEVTRTPRRAAKPPAVTAAAAAVDPVPVPAPAVATPVVATVAATPVSLVAPVIQQAADALRDILMNGRSGKKNKKEQRLEMVAVFEQMLTEIAPPATPRASSTTAPRRDNKLV